ncbi:hypothetical protein [Mycobacterium simiae]|uniref:hypothetical protein n=1 Tax=Mycobacterium simiae TaxID=1784 RepID=UPI000CB546C3|nr:hypothetical protein [Mycobacterium simiae]PLV46274.1 hypothetical protein X011_21700 [Mycobacterium tuberculosis variant microti OV254]BBX41329.1 UsfY protein [Mycobacterium simiae]
MSYPVDHERTTRRHAGETLKNPANAPGVAAIVLAVAALTFGLYEFAARQVSVGVVAVVLAVALGAFGSVWLARAHRKVREAERQLSALASDEPPPPPTS